MRKALRFLGPVVFIQVLTAALVFAIANGGDFELRLTVGLLCLGVSILASFWFGAISSAGHVEAMAKAEERHARARERLKVNAEKEKRQIMQESHRTLVRERDKFKRKSDIKAAASFVGVIGLGAVAVFSQFVTFGLLLLAAGGGAAGGYMLRLKHEHGRDGTQLPVISAKLSGLLSRDKKSESRVA